MQIINEQLSSHTESRSPNYPQLPLAVAIKWAKKLKDSKRDLYVSLEELAQNVFGFKNKDQGAFRNVVSSLNHYQLINYENKSVSLSPHANELLECLTNTKRYFDLLRKSMLFVEPFRNVFDQLGGATPNLKEIELCLLAQGFAHKGGRKKATIIFLKNIKFVQANKPSAHGNITAETSTKRVMISYERTLTRKEIVVELNEFLTLHFPQSSTPTAK